jgi:hypothetical protein
MPTKKLRLSQREARDYRSELLQLRRAGVAVGHVGDFSQKPSSRLQQNLRLRQIDHEFATIYDLPGVALAVVIPTKLLITTSGILIVRAEMRVPWDPTPLELEDPERHAFFDRVITGLIPCPPKLLNTRLTGSQNLHRGQWEGVIVGTSYSSVPVRYDEDAQVPITLSLWDEQDNKLSFTFHASVNRVYKQRYEREQTEWRRTHKRIPLFSPEARLLKKEGMEPAGIRWLRELERSPRMTDESRVAESEATDVAALDLERRALLDQSMSSLIEQAAAMQPQSGADLPDDQNENDSFEETK